MPVIYRGPADTGYRPASGEDAFGPLGTVNAVTVHHSAGPRAPTKERACQLHRAYQRDHIDRGFGDIGYHFSMDDRGRFYVLRNIQFKGAHVGGHNTGNVGLMVHGNYDHDRLTRAQRESLLWLFRGGLLELTGHREAEYAIARGHKEWDGHHSNACPGRNLMAEWAKLRSRELNR